MELTYVREFVTLARLENFMSAADELFISQSSLSKHIKTLESELGVLLFDRTTRRVHLNHFGKAFLPYAEEMVRLDDESHNRLTALAHDTDETLRLAVLPSFILRYQKALEQFRGEYPGYAFHMQEGSGDEVLRLVAEGACNLGYARFFREDISAQFDLLSLGEDPLVAAIPFDHPLNDGRKTISVEELTRYDLFISTNPVQERMLRELEERCGVRLNITLRLDRSDFITHLVEQKAGISIHMYSSARLRQKGRFQLLLIEPETSSQLALVWKKGQKLNAAARSFLSIMQEAGRVNE